MAAQRSNAFAAVSMPGDRRKSDQAEATRPPKRRLPSPQGLEDWQQASFAFPGALLDIILITSSMHLVAQYREHTTVLFPNADS